MSVNKVLEARRNELIKLYKIDRKQEYLEEMYCIDTLFECEGITTYQKIAELCKEHGFGKVYDIGCAYGHQSEVFLENGLQYTGIERMAGINFFNQSKCDYQELTYPNGKPLGANKKTDVGISVLCLTWNCYLYDGIKTLEQQLKALADDFDYIILYCTYKDSIKDMIVKYFDVISYDVKSQLGFFKAR